MTMQALFYKALTSGNMWDTWLYYHRDTYYLFHLAGPGGQWHGIAMATSSDGVQWQEHGLVIEKAAGVTWLGTGSVWTVPSRSAGPRFLLNFSEWRGNAQTIFFAESTDLLHWRRLGNEYEFKPDGRWYNTDGGNDGRWDCIYTIDRPGGGRHGYWTANPRDFTGFGFGESDDGLTWRALPPPRIEWGAVAPMPVIESGAVAEIGGLYYTMLGSYKEYGPHSSGMFSFVADSPAGPFRPVTTNFALLASPKGRWHTYFARFFPIPGTLLVNHHAIAQDGEVFLAPLKQAIVDGGGALRLTWWPGNDAVKQHWKMSLAGTHDTISYRPTAGLLLEGHLSIPGKPNDPTPEFTVACGAGGQATRFSVGQDGVVEIAESAADGCAASLQQVDRALRLAGSIPFRLLLMHGFVEFYLADHLVQAHALPGKPAGRLGIKGVHEPLKQWEPPA